jgi:putative endonuclease
MNKQDLGKKGERLVCCYLEKHSFLIKAVNYTQKSGEIDIIAQKGNLLIFVEVKLRSHLYFALSEVITPSKQKKIIQTACHYRSIYSIHEMILRFDVALLSLKEEEYEVTYISDAFRPADGIFI